MLHPAKIVTIANIITFFRIICTIFFIISMITDNHDLSIIFFIIAGISDFFDGYIARLRNEETALGALLDPIADKFLLISAINILFLQQKTILIPLWFLCLLIIKEGFQIIGGSILWYKSGISALLRPSAISKLTTTLLLIFITCLLFSHFYVLSSQCLSFLLFCSTALLFGSFVHYIMLFLKKIAHLQ